MDTFTWGPLLWRWIEDVARKADQYHLSNFEENQILISEKDRQKFEKVKKITIDFFNNLARVEPCMYCRASTALFLKTNPVEKAFEKNKMIEYVYIFKSMVIYKLDRTCYLSIDKLFKRLRIYTQMISDWEIIDLLFIMALNFPSSPKENEYESRMKGYRVLLESLPDILKVTEHHLLLKAFQDTSTNLFDQIDWIIASQSNLFSRLLVFRNAYEELMQIPKDQRSTAEDVIAQYKLADAKWKWYDEQSSHPPSFILSEKNSSSLPAIPTKRLEDELPKLEAIEVCVDGTDFHIPQELAILKCDPAAVVTHPPPPANTKKVFGRNVLLTDSKFKKVDSKDVCKPSDLTIFSNLQQPNWKRTKSF